MVAGNLSIWHPVGAHAGESLQQIIARKQRDVGRHGFTLWAFASARRERVDAWRKELSNKGQDACTVVCCGDSTRDPLVRGAEAQWLTEYSSDLEHWDALPAPRMVSYHRGPRKGGVVASAFVVDGITVPSEVRVERPRTWFLANEQKWLTSSLPTRGEYLVRTPTPSRTGKTVRLLLHLVAPFVVWVR